MDKETYIKYLKDYLHLISFYLNKKEEPSFKIDESNFNFFFNRNGIFQVALLNRKWKDFCILVLFEVFRIPFQSLWACVRFQVVTFEIHGSFLFGLRASVFWVFFLCLQGFVFLPPSGKLITSIFLLFWISALRILSLVTENSSESLN